MTNKFINFNENIICEIINDLAKSTPGIKRGILLKFKNDLEKNQKLSIDINLKFEKNIYDIMNLSLDFKNLLYSNLSSKIDIEQIEINIYIG